MLTMFKFPEVYFVAKYLGSTKYSTTRIPGQCGA